MPIREPGFPGGLIRTVRTGAADFWRYGLAILGILLVGILGAEYLDDRPWRAAFYDNPDLAGEPAAITRHARIDFDWRAGPPLVGFVDDGFSVRWDTCLHAGDRGAAVLRLTLEGGGRVLLNGRPVIDRWETGEPAAVRQRVQLRPGAHHLVVEYVDRRGWARIRLGYSSQRLPDPRFEHPRPDPSRPCQDRPGTDGS